jgi:hypothetical protein
MQHKKYRLSLLTSTANSRTIKKAVQVEFTKFAEKQMSKLPNHISE